LTNAIEVIIARLSESIFMNLLNNWAKFVGKLLSFIRIKYIAVRYV